MRNGLLTLAVRLACGAPVTAQQLVTHPNIPYATVPPGVDANLLSLDIYTVAGWTNHPVMAYVHGGSWQEGDKANVAQKPTFFRDQEWVFVSVNYRLLPDVTWDVQPGDVAAALAWVFRHIAAYGGGGDAGGPTPWLHNTAWIYRGTLPDDTTPFSISGTTATLTLETTAGWKAQVQFFPDLNTWTNQGSAFVGNNAPRTVNQNISGQPRRFYRVQHTRTTP